MASALSLSSLLLFSLLLLLSSSPLLVSSGRCNTDDKKALLAIKAAFNNAYHFASWTPSSACCDWYDVDCDLTTGRVIGLSIFQDANVSGEIPAAVGDLPYLKNLMFHHLPGVIGPIPPALTKLTNLDFLTISWTGVSGPVPAFLSSLPSLSQLDLSFNSLSGSIPPSLGDPPKLSFIDISRNSLSGPLPATLFQKSPPQPYLRLSHNHLTGEIPSAYGRVGFVQIDLSRNQLIGDGSLLFGRSKPAQQLDLSRNQFEFDLSGVEFPEDLASVDLNHNRIYGSIPQQITKVENLQFFNVSYNRLCGEIPTGGQMGRFDQYDFLHNKCLCGAPLPPCK